MAGRLWILFALMLRPAVAQSTTTGSIKGRVLDAEEATLSGVAITIASENLLGGVQQTQTDENGRFLFAELPPGTYELTASQAGFKTHKRLDMQVTAGRSTIINVTLAAGSSDEIIRLSGRPVIDTQSGDRGAVLTSDFLQRIPAGRSYQSAVQMASGTSRGAHNAAAQLEAAIALMPPPAAGDGVEKDGDSFTDHGVHGFTMVEQDALSTFSIDVDTASYALSRRYIDSGTLPPAEAVRVEEFVNYLDYSYPQPDNAHPFAADFEVFDDPFRSGRHILRVGVQGKDIQADVRPPLRLTFLVDVSGSMRHADKLPLAQEAMHLLVDTLQEGDTVALATYAGRTARILSPTDATNERKIHAAIDSLRSGGSTAMSSGLDIAYNMAQRSFEGGAENRVIVLSDGDANVGSTSWEEMLAQIKDQADQGITLSTIGFGTGNYQDTLMEQLANNGDGNNYYIDSRKQARRVFVDEMQSTIVTIARDVKLQVDFDPSSVIAYRLIGYENRDIADEDFRDDRVDAGEVGADHNVTALYELILRGRPRGTLATLNLRYETPGADKKATEIVFPCTVRDLGAPSGDSQMAYASATFAELLRGSPHTEELTLDALHRYARGADRGGADDKELIKLIKSAERVGMVSAR